MIRMPEAEVREVVGAGAVAVLGAGDSKAASFCSHRDTRRGTPKKVATCTTSDNWRVRKGVQGRGGEGGEEGRVNKGVRKGMCQV